MIDTVGLHSTSKTADQVDRYASQLMDFLNSQAGNQISLVLFVFRQGRITQDEQDNYQFFVECLCNKLVPVLLVITGAEYEEPLDDWWQRNKDLLHNQYRWMTSLEAVSVCALDVNDYYDDKNEEKAQYLIDKINRSRAQLMDKIQLTISTIHSPNGALSLFGTVEEQALRKAILQGWLRTHLGAGQLNKASVIQSKRNNNNNSNCLVS